VICVNFVQIFSRVPKLEPNKWSDPTLQSTQCNVINVTSLLRHSLLINMPFTNEDKLSIKFPHQEKGRGARRICKEFSHKKWAVSSVRDLLRKIDTKNSISRKAGSGRPRTVRMEQNIERVAELICSREDNPGSSKSPRDIEKLTGISRSSLRRVVGLDDLKDRMCTCWASLDQQFMQQSCWSVATPIKSSSTSSRTAHWTVVYLTVWLLYAAVTWKCTSTHCCMFCHCDIGPMMFECFDSIVIFWTTCWYTNLVWASIYVGYNISPHGMLLVNVNKYSSTINSRI